MEQIVSQIFAPVVKILNDHIAKHLAYVTSSTKHVNNMRNKMKILEDTSVDVKQHMERNKISNKVIPTGVPRWLNDVETLKEKLQSIPSDGIGCLNIKMRYQAGSKACKDTERIEALITERSEFIWSDALLPTGRVNSMPTSTIASTSSSSPLGEEGFKSRDMPFKEALKFLHQDYNKSQVIALCGMGGVGKTTMMEQLKTVANDKKMFNWIVKVVIGRSPNILSIQNDIAISIGGERLREESVTARADSLFTLFKKRLEDGKTKILVILDDVWEKVELKDIGLTSPLSSGVKLLLTSRNSNICKQIAADVDSIFQVVSVDVLEEAEAQNFFSQITGVSRKDDYDLFQIGCDIVKKCGCLPLAIKLIGTTLKSREKFVWRSTFQRLNNNDIDKDVQEIIKISYEYIRNEEEKEIFLLCGLFPEDSDIPIEYLTRYAWGLNLLKEVSTLEYVRDSTKTCVDNLINANLLIHSNEYLGCVKVHDLVLAFVLGTVCRGNHPWIVNHGDISKHGAVEKESCKTISLTCMDMTQFTSDIKYSYLYLLQLMGGDYSLKFPKDFYKRMENLKVIAYHKIQYPLLPRSLENLKTLCLEECKLMFDCSFVGDLVHLEVLSFAHCRIRKLPFAIGNLKKLKLLDLTGCFDLHIDDGVFKNLVKLEELYMRVSKGEPIRFTDTNFKELAMLSTQLCALEVEFVEKTIPANVSFENLYKFKISIGCMLDNVKQNEKYAFKNTLKVVTDRSSDIVDLKMNEMFRKTEELYLQVKEMICLKDVVPIHRCDHHPFFNLKDLVLHDCAKLKYMFTISMASGLRKLERLTIRSCLVLEALIHNDGSEINSVGEMIKFEKLKLLSLEKLPKLESLFLIDNAVELPQLVELVVDGLPNFTSIYPVKNDISSLLNSKVRISKLEKLNICSMEKLKQVWDVDSTCEVEVNTIFMLREIKISRCNCLENLFPSNPMRLMHHLEMLTVRDCDSIEEIFNIDLGCVSDVEPVGKSCLKSIIVEDSKKLRHVWRIKGGENNSSLIHGFEAVEQVKIIDCKRFENVFTPTNTKFDMRALKEIRIEGPQIEIEEEKEVNEGVEVIFEIEDQGSSPSHTELMVTTTNNQQSLLSNLQHLRLKYLKRMSDVWKCNNWNKFLSLQKQSSAFQNLTTIYIRECHRLKYLFSPLMAKLLSNLKTIDIRHCDGMEEVVSNRDDEDEEMTTTTTHTFFPHLHSLSFEKLKNLKVIGGVNKVNEGVKVIFEIEDQGSPSNQQSVFPNLQLLDLSYLKSMSDVWKCNNWNKFFLSLQKQSSAFQNLTTIEIWHCHRLKYLFSPLMAKLLSNLKTIDIFECDGMEEVVLNRDDEDEEMTTTTTHTFFPHLHSLRFNSLRNLKVIGGVNKFSQVGVLSWSLCQYSREIHIHECDALSRLIPFYAAGQMQNLQVLYLYKCESLTEVFETQGMNNNNSGDGGSGSDIDEGNGGDNTTTLTIPRLEYINMPPQLSNLKVVVIYCCNLLKHVFTITALESLTQLEELTITGCKEMKVIVNKENGDQKGVVVFPSLKCVELSYLPNLNGFFFGMNEFQWPLLEKVTLEECPQMMMFTSGQSTTPKLRHIHTRLGKHSLECGLNFHMPTDFHETQLPSSEGMSLCSTASKPLPAWSFHNLIEVDMEYDWGVKCIIPSNELQQLQKLERMRVSGCLYVKKVFEAEALMEGTTQTVVQIPNLTQIQLIDLHSLKYIWKSNHHHHVLEFPNLTTLIIDLCNSLKHVFTSSMVGSLQQLQHLHISNCSHMEVIVKEEEEEEESECDIKVKEIEMLPCLKSLKLEKLKNLKGFYLGKKDFSWPSLHTLEIIACHEITVFTKGHVATPALNMIDTSFGRCDLMEDINSFIETKLQEGFSFYSGEHFGRF